VLSDATQLEQAVNVARRDAGIAELQHDGCAERVAADRAETLVGVDELIHDDLDDVLSECGVARAGENLARSDHPAPEVVDAWLASPGHASNILDAGFDRGAVACVPDGDELLCSQIFLESSDSP